MNLRLFFTAITALLAVLTSSRSTSAAGVDPAVATVPAITSIQIDGNTIIVSARVPAGPKKIILQSSRRLGTGAWEPRAILRVDGQGGEVVFRVNRSPDLEIVRVRADSADSLPSFFFQGTNSFPGAVVSTSTTNPELVAFDSAGQLNGTAAVDSRAVAEAAPSSRDVVESDIWQIEGNILYFFNQYRGLQVIDITQPDSPVTRGTYSLPAVGEQMYWLPSQHAVLLARNGCNWGAESTSQVLILDVAGASPRLVTSLPLSGQIQESRLVGSALYVMTQTYRPILNSKDGAWEWGTSISSFDLSNPAVPVTRSTLWFGGYGNVLSATDQALFVCVNNGDKGSQIQFIDITAPDGTMKTAGAIHAAGNVTDKFKMQLHGEIFTVISQHWSWESPNQTGRWQPVTKLETFSLFDPAAPRKLGELELAKGEQLHATRFDGNRVYVVTFLRIDPLWVVDLSDPTKPAIRGELHVPGWSTYIQPYGDRLVAIGIDNTNGWRVAVSLFDVRDPAAPALLSKVPLGENSSWSEANSDEKAFGFLPDAGLILVPFSTYSTNQQEGVQLIDFSQNSLVKRGFIPHAMQARRSTVHQNRILSISGRELLSVDASDRDKPVVRSEIPLAWGVDRVFVQGDYLIQIETASTWAPNPQAALRVVPVAKSEQVVNALGLGNLPVIGSSLRDGRLYLLQGNPAYSGVVFLAEDQSGTGGTKAVTNSARLVCSVVDVTKLPQIQVLSSTELFTAEGYDASAVPLWPKPDLLVWATQQASYWPWRFGLTLDLAVGVSTMPVRGGLWYPFSNSSRSQLLALDVADPLAPKFVSDVTLTSTNGWANFSKPSVADNSVFISRQLTETSITDTNYFVTTNLVYTLATNVVVVTNYTKVPQFTVQTNDTLVTNTVTIAVKNTLPQPLRLNAAASIHPAIAGGVAHSAAVTADGSVWTWGSNNHGQLGDPTATERSNPVAVPLLSGIQSLASGAFHMLALKADGTVWAWGDDGFGQLGNGSGVSDPNFPPMPELDSRVPVQALGLRTAISIAAGNWHSLAVQADGTVWGWGANWAGQLGDGTWAGRSTPGPISQLSEIVQVSAGLAHSLALRRDGTVWAWGNNSSGQLGNGTRTDANTPALIPGLSEVVAVAGGHSHSLALKKDGTLWAWGLNQSGQLGDGTAEDRLIPEPVPGLDQVVAIACGQSHSLALRNDGTLWVWGRNKDGQRADPERSDALRPILAAQLPRVAALATGANHSLASTPDGTALYAWGNNGYGQLGSGLPLTFTGVYKEFNTVTITSWTEVTEVVTRTNLVRVPISTTVTNAMPVYTSRQLFYLDVVDYTVPATPVLRAPITIPGALLGVSHQGALVYLLGPGLNQGTAETGREWLHACAYDGVACYLVDSHPLAEQWPHPVLVNAPNVFIGRPEVEKVHGRGLEIWAVSDVGKLIKVNEQPVKSNVSALQVVGDLLLAQEDASLEVFGLQQPGQAPRVGGGEPSGCLGWTLESAAGSLKDGLWLPLGLFGVEQIELTR